FERISYPFASLISYHLRNLGMDFSCIFSDLSFKFPLLAIDDINNHHAAWKNIVDIPCLAIKKAKINKRLMSLKDKPLHGMLHRAVQDGELDVTTASAWLSAGNIEPCDEGVY
ncbi:MAG: hypothetical protein MHPSP_004192, partial [Paramarteilia canceri]